MFEYPAGAAQAYPIKVLIGLLKSMALQAHGHMPGELEASGAKGQADMGAPRNEMRG